MTGPSEWAFRTASASTSGPPPRNRFGGLRVVSRGRGGGGRRRSGHVTGGDVTGSDRVRHGRDVVTGVDDERAAEPEPAARRGVDDARRLAAVGVGGDPWRCL